MGAERGQSRRHRARVDSTNGKPRSKNQLSAALADSCRATGRRGEKFMPDGICSGMVTPFDAAPIIGSGGPIQGVYAVRHSLMRSAVRSWFRRLFSTPELAQGAANEPMPPLPDQSRC
jgi:hypothetical protein